MRLLGPNQNLSRSARQIKIQSGSLHTADAGYAIAFAPEHSFTTADSTLRATPGRVHGLTMKLNAGVRPSPAARAVMRILPPIAHLRIDLKAIIYQGKLHSEGATYALTLPAWSSWLCKHYARL